MSAAHFQFPSVCFSQTSRYFPRSLIGLPLASFIVNSYVPLTHAISPDLPTCTLVGCQVMTKPGLANMSFQRFRIASFVAALVAFGAKHDRVIRIEGDCLLDIFSCCRFRPVAHRDHEEVARPVGYRSVFPRANSKAMIARSKRGSLW